MTRRMLSTEITEVVALDLSEQEMKELEDTFRLFNQDDDGVISLKEVEKVLISLGQDPTSSEIKALVEPFDIDGDGTIDFSEFVGVMQQLKTDANQADDDLIDVFRILDQDGDGYISQGDLRDIVGRLGLDLSQQEMEEMITEVDKDGDGEIDYEEFLAIAKAKL